LECDQNVVFHVETDLFDAGDRLEMIAIDHLADEKQRVFEDIQLRALLGRFDISNDQRMKIESFANTH
jgi:hypothetical protein